MAFFHHRLKLVLMLMTALAAYGQERCPWLNAATAGGVLGGEVTVGVTPTSCGFELRHGGIESRLTIEVAAVHLPWTARCGPQQTSLNAIGNEAVACGGVARAEHWAKVVGRVRDQGFTIELRTTGSADTLAEKARSVAEQVAGTLF